MMFPTSVMGLVSELPSDKFEAMLDTLLKATNSVVTHHATYDVMETTSLRRLNSIETGERYGIQT